MHTAVAFDLDDTLLRNDRTISPFTLNILRKAAAQGIILIPASGRSAASMASYVDQLGCASAYVGCNGAEIMAPNHQPLHLQYLSVPLAHRIARFAAEHGAYAQCYYGDGFYFNRHGPEAVDYAEASSLKGTWVGDLTKFIQSSTPKMLIQAEPAEVLRLRAAANALFGQEAQVTISKPCFLEFNPPGTSKGAAIGWLAAHLGFHLTDTMAFGDSYNDLSMLTLAGHGVAMANAAPEVRAQTRYHCDTNQADGVARYLAAHLGLQQ